MKNARNFIRLFLLHFALLGALFIPFDFTFLHIQSQLTSLLFSNAIQFICSLIPALSNAHPDISSDSMSLYVLVGILFTLAALITTIGWRIPIWRTHYSTITYYIRLFLTYYLALIILKYGFDKLFKSQFYLPEPNTLYTPLGMLDKDILFWSTMGTSYSYNIFMGIMEIIPALFLLFNKTRLLGFCLLLGVLTNIWAINLSFDISVKLYTSFLLLINLVLLAPNMPQLARIFFTNKPYNIPPKAPAIKPLPKNAKRLLQTTLGLIIFAETLLPTIVTQQFNDDKTPRNYLHGAYQVDTIQTQKGETNGAIHQIKRVFIHRQQYLIFQFTDDTMEDYKLHIIPEKQLFELTDYEGNVQQLTYTFDHNKQHLTIHFASHQTTIHTHALPWKQLPALKPLFHWTVDGI
jgi:hypothetical protein